MQYSIVQKTDLDKIVLRLDAEYYHPDCLSLEKKLGQFCSISLREAGSRFDCSAFYPSIVPYYDFEKAGVPFLRVNEIQNGLLHISDGTAFLPQSILHENRTTIAECRPGDLLIAKGGNSLAKAALVTEDFKKFSVCRDIIILRTQNLKKISRYYLWMFLHSTVGQKLLLRTASQTGQPHLTLEAISQIEIPIFSEVFQNSFEWLYSESQRLKNKSEARYREAQTLLLSELGLTNWQPKHQLTFIKNYSDTEQAERIDAEYYQPKYDELLQRIHQNSKYTKLISEIQVQNTRGLQPKYSKDGSLDVITSKHILEAGLDFDNFDKTDLANWNLQKKARVKKGSILTYTTGANIGRTAIYQSEKQALASNHVNILTIEEEDPEYVAFVMNSLIGRLQTERFSAGSAQAELYPQDIGDFVIPFIEKKKQIQIQQKVAESFNYRKQSIHLLEIAKRTVEMAIEQDEQGAINWLEKETKGIRKLHVAPLN